MSGSCGRDSSRSAQAHADFEFYLSAVGQSFQYLREVSGVDRGGAIGGPGALVRCSPVWLHRVQARNDGLCEVLDTPVIGFPDVGVLDQSQIRSMLGSISARSASRCGEQFVSLADTPMRAASGYWVGGVPGAQDHRGFTIRPCFG